MTEQTSIINWKSVATTVVSFGAAVYGASLAEDIKDAIISSSKSFATALESSNDTAEDAGTPVATPKRKSRSVRRSCARWPRATAPSVNHFSMR